MLDKVRFEKIYKYIFLVVFMKKNTLVLIVVIGIIIVGISSYYFMSNKQKGDSCEDLAKELDKRVSQNGEIFGEIIKSRYGGVVGGTLISSSQPFKFYTGDTNTNTYTLTFKGYSKEGILYLRASANKDFSYQIGQFYKINLSEMRFSGMLSGMFLDPEMNKLQLVACN